jgi:hypothetical protein
MMWKKLAQMLHDQSTSSLCIEILERAKDNVKKWLSEVAPAFFSEPEIDRFSHEVFFD